MGEKGKPVMYYGIRQKQTIGNLTEDIFKTIYNMLKR